MLHLVTSYSVTNRYLSITSFVAFLLLDRFPTVPPTLPILQSSSDAKRVTRTPLYYDEHGKIVAATSMLSNYSFT